MVRAAVAGQPGFAVDDREIRRSGVSYSVDTLVTLASGPGEPAGLEFILSAEAFAGFPSWHEPGRILELARLAVVPRAGARPVDAAWLDEHLPAWRDRVDFVGGPLVDVSASVIRDRVRAGLPIDGLVPRAVADYIAAHHLYTERL